MLSLSNVELRSEKTIQGLISWACSPSPAPPPPAPFFFLNANVLLHSISLRLVMTDILLVQALSE